MSDVDVDADADADVRQFKRARPATSGDLSLWGQHAQPARAQAHAAPRRAAIPGPAGEHATPVSSQQQQATQSSMQSKRSTRRSVATHAAELETAGDKIFRRSAWQALLESRSLPPFGSAPLIGRAATLARVQRDGAWKKAARLAVFVLRITLTETDAIIVARDPTGEMMGTVHRSVLEDYPLLTAGAALDLKLVPVFAPDVRHRYLNIMPENIERVFLASAQPIRRDVAPPDDPLAAYSVEVREDIATRRAALAERDNVTPVAAAAAAGGRDPAADKARALLMRSAATARRRQGGPRRGRERTDNADNDEMPTPAPKNPIRGVAQPQAPMSAPTPLATLLPPSQPPPTPYQPPRQQPPVQPVQPVQPQQPVQRPPLQQPIVLPPQRPATQSAPARSSLTAFRPSAIVSSLTQQSQAAPLGAPATSGGSNWPSTWPAPPTRPAAAAAVTTNAPTNAPAKPPARLTRFDELDDDAFLELDV
jgi:hypothetical protein